MRFDWKSFGLVVCLSMAAAPASAAPILTLPALEYSQDGVTYTTFDSMVGRQKVKNYYDYSGLSGHPNFGTVRGVSSAGVYWDEKRGALSLMVISGSPRKGWRSARGEVLYDFSGLPSSAYLNVSDDPKDIKYHHGHTTAKAHFTYGSSTDGLVLSGLEQAGFAIAIALTPIEGIRQWRLVDGGGGQFIDLDMAKPLFVRTVDPGGGSVDPPGPVVPPVSGGSDGPGVPEPGVGLAGIAALGLLSLRRRG